MGTGQCPPPPDPEPVAVPVVPEPEPVPEPAVPEPIPDPAPVVPEVEEEEEDTGDVPVARSAALIEESLNASLD